MIVEYEEILLDDYGMALKRRLLEAYDDLKASESAVTFHRYWAREQDYLIVSNDYMPRSNVFINRGLEFMEHYYLLIQQKDIVPVRHLQWHLFLDGYAWRRIETVRGLLRWGLIPEADVKNMIDLVQELRRCKHRRNTKPLLVPA